MKPDKSPLIQLVQRLCSPNPTEPQDSSHLINPKQIAKQQKEKYIDYWKEVTLKQNKLECYLNLKRQYTMAEYLITVSEPKVRKTLTKYRLSEHSLAIETGRHRQTWLPREERLCSVCSQGEVETELHFLTECDHYKDIRTKYFPQITNIYKEFENVTNRERLVYLLGEKPNCCILAAKYVSACHGLRDNHNEINL